MNVVELIDWLNEIAEVLTNQTGAVSEPRTFKHHLEEVLLNHRLLVATRYLVPCAPVNIWDSEERELKTIHETALHATPAFMDAFREAIGSISGMLRICEEYEAVCPRYQPSPSSSDLATNRQLEQKARFRLAEFGPRLNRIAKVLWKEDPMLKSDLPPGAWLSDPLTPVEASRMLFDDFYGTRVKDYEWKRLKTIGFERVSKRQIAIRMDILKARFPPRYERFMKFTSVSKTMKKN